MKLEILAEIDEEKELDECKYFSGILLPVALLKQHIDHDDDELSHIDRAFVEIEALLDLGENFRLQLLQQFVFKIDVEHRRSLLLLDADFGKHHAFASFPHIFKLQPR